MATHIKRRKTRVEDFRMRVARSSASSVYLHPNGWQYFPVHHFADETDGKVFKVDCWCLLEEDGAMLECIVEGFSLPRSGTLCPR